MHEGRCEAAVNLGRAKGARQASNAKRQSTAAPEEAFSSNQPKREATFNPRLASSMWSKAAFARTPELKGAFL
jgi:hypothetical protein